MNMDDMIFMATVGLINLIFAAEASKGEQRMLKWGAYILAGLCAVSLIIMLVAKFK